MKKNIYQLIAPISEREIQCIKGSGDWSVSPITHNTLITLPLIQTHLITVGSGIYSGATISAYGFEYEASINRLRLDKSKGAAVVDNDWFLIHRYNNFPYLYKVDEHFTPNHWIQDNSCELVEKLPINYQYYIKSIIEGKISY